MPENGNSRNAVESENAGEVVVDCRIDLPKNDVVESIDFERFFMLTLSVGGDARSLATNPYGAFANRQGVPFSPNEADWAGVSSLVRKQRAQLNSGDVKALIDDVGHLDESPSPTMLQQLAIYLPFRQTWKLRGYNQGRLVNSFTLAPQEEQTVEIFKWDRFSSTLESTGSFESAETSESSSTRRDTLDITQDLARQTGFEINSSGNVGFKVGVVNADVSAGFNARSAVNDAEKETRNSIAEATTRSTSQVRTSRTLKVVESREQGQESRVTRKLRNANSCHALTVAFFEILANYRVQTAIRTQAVRLVLLISSDTVKAITGFTSSTLREHETTLRLALLDKALQDGFEAARFLDARSRGCDILCGSCECDPAAGEGQNSTQLTNLRIAAVKLADTVAQISGTAVLFPLTIPPLILGPVAASVSDVRRFAFRQALQAYAPSLLGELVSLNLPAQATLISAAQLAAIERTAAKISEENLIKLTNDGIVRDGVKADIFKALWVLFPEPITAGVLLGIVWGHLNSLPVFDDFGLVNAISTFRTAYREWQKWVLEQETKDEKIAALRRLEKQERELRLLEAFPLRETADAQERLETLLSHLNDPRNRDHYRFAVWNERSGAADTTLMSLALAGFTEPYPVGMVGDLLAVPIKTPPGSIWERFLRDTLSDLVANPPIESQDHILPTPALYSEAIVGTCCACEDSLEMGTQLDLDRKDLENELIKLEARRVKARLEAVPPILDVDKSDPPAIRVEVVRTSTPTATSSI